MILQALDDLETGAIAAIQNSGAETFIPLKAGLLQLEKLIKSHFGYEETELEEALGYYGVKI